MNLEKAQAHVRDSMREMMAIYLEVSILGQKFELDEATAPLINDICMDRRIYA